MYKYIFLTLIFISLHSSATEIDNCTEVANNYKNINPSENIKNLLCENFKNVEQLESEMLILQKEIATKSESTSEALFQTLASKHSAKLVCMTARSYLNRAALEKFGKTYQYQADIECNITR